MITISRQLRRLAAVAFVMFMLPMLGSCGDTDGGETVYFFVVNGYAGAETLSVYGPTGPLAEEVAFGERVGPLAFDRRFGGEITVLLEGTPEPVELELSVFEFYPQETSTLFFKKRSDANDIAISVYRHVQTVTNDFCVLTMENGLSAGDRYTTGTHFSFAAEFNKTPTAAGYLDEEQVGVPTECGILPTPTRAPIPRTELLALVTSDPWFFVTECENELFTRNVCYVWGVLDEENIVGFPSTLDYYNCIAGAISIRQPDDMGDLPFPPEGAQAQCPDGELTWADVQVDPIGVRECQARKSYQAEMLEPAGGGTSGQSWSLRLVAKDGACNPKFRIRTSNLDVIFGPKDDDCTSTSCEGSHLNGALVVSDIKIPAGSEHFFVLFGRPVNPLIWQWNSGQNFVDLSAFPYANGQITRISDHDDSGSGNSAK